MLVIDIMVCQCRRDDSFETAFCTSHSEKVQSNKRLIVKSGTKIQSQGSDEEAGFTNMQIFFFQDFNRKHLETPRLSSEINCVEDEGIKFVYNRWRTQSI